MHLAEKIHILLNFEELAPHLRHHLVSMVTFQGYSCLSDEPNVGHSALGG